MAYFKLLISSLLILAVACAPKQRPRPYLKKESGVNTEFVQADPKSLTPLTPEKVESNVEPGFKQKPIEILDTQTQQKLSWVHSVLNLTDVDLKINSTTQVVKLEANVVIEKQDHVDTDIKMHISLSGVIDSKTNEIAFKNTEKNTQDLRVSGEGLCDGWFVENGKNTCYHMPLEIFLRKEKGIYSRQFVYLNKEVAEKAQAESKKEAEEKAKLDGKEETNEDDDEADPEDPDMTKGIYIISSEPPEDIVGAKAKKTSQLAEVSDPVEIKKLTEARESAEKIANEKKAEQEKESLKKAEFENKLAEIDRLLKDIETKFGVAETENAKLKAQLDTADSTIKAAEEKQKKSQTEIDLAKASEAKAKAEAASAKKRTEAAQKKVDTIKVELDKANGLATKKEEAARKAQELADKTKIEKDKLAAQTALEQAQKAKADVEAKAKVDVEAHAQLKREQDSKLKAEKEEQAAREKAESEAKLKLAAEEAKRTAEQEKLEATKKQKDLEFQVVQEKAKKVEELKKAEEAKIKAEADAKKAQVDTERAKKEAEKALAEANLKEKAEADAKALVQKLKNEQEAEDKLPTKGLMLDAKAYDLAYKNKLGGSNLKPEDFVIHSLSQANSGSQKKSIKLSDRVRDIGQSAPMREVNPKDREDYGNPVMIEFINQVSQQAREKVINRSEWVSEVRDISKENGGYLYGHKSHQNGLDADIGYVLKTKDSGYYGRDVVNGHHLDSDFDLEKQYEWFTKMVASNVAQVHYIFVHQTIKSALCKMAKEKGVFADPNNGDNANVLRMLRRLSSRPTDHGDHFHLRLKCPLNNKGCYLYPETKNVHGCH
jgi:hypothetical protein